MIRIKAALVGLAVVVCGSALNAQSGWWYAWDAGLAGYARLPLRTGNVPTPPYFALHPPVYYGHIQRRDYGQSPFAQWPCCCHAAQARELRQGQRNPYVVNQGDSEAPAPGRERVASRALLIENPYYQPHPVSDGDSIAGQ